MTLKEFKEMAQREGTVYDNSEKASAEWSHTWGLSWWRSLWSYKEYTYNGYTYRSGNVYTRHTHYRVTEYAVGKELISRLSFIKAISAMEYKEFVRPKRFDEKPMQMEFLF